MSNYFHMIVSYVSLASLVTLEEVRTKFGVSLD